MSSEYQLSPVVLFAYNRSEHVSNMLLSLSRNELAEKTILYVYIDGPKEKNDFEKVGKVLNIVRNIKCFKELIIIEREKNYGLAQNIITGVSEVVDKFGKVIVLEDDLIVSPKFLNFMNEMLNMYENDINVASIHGYVYPTNSTPKEPFFIRGADCWGWATWKRAWLKFQPDGKVLLNQILKSKNRKKFDFDYSYPFFRMLKDQINGKNNSWAIRWNASVFLEGMLTLYPPKSYIRNDGFDDSGTHCEATDNYLVELQYEDINFSKVKCVESKVGYIAFKKYFINIRGGWMKYILRRIFYGEIF